MQEVNGTGKTPSPVKEHQRALQLQDQQRRRQQQMLLQQQQQQLQQQAHVQQQPPAHMGRGGGPARPPADLRMDPRNGLPPLMVEGGRYAAVSDPRDPRSGGMPDYHRHILHDPRSSLLIDPRALGPSDLRDPRANGPLEHHHARMAARGGPAAAGGGGHHGIPADPRHHHAAPPPQSDPRLHHDGGRYGPPQEAALRLDVGGRHYAAGAVAENAARTGADPRLVSPQQQLAEGAGRRADSRGSNPPGEGGGGRRDPPPRLLMDQFGQELERTLGGGSGYPPDSSSRHSQPDSSGRPAYYAQPQADSSK